MTKQEIIYTLESCRCMELKIAWINQQLSQLDELRELSLDENSCPCKAYDNSMLGCLLCDNVQCKVYCMGEMRLKDALKDQYNHALSISMRCRTMIELLPNPIQSRILYLHYVDGLDWQRVSKTVHYSLSFCMKQRRQAIEQLARLLK